MSKSEHGQLSSNRSINTADILRCYYLPNLMCLFWGNDIASGSCLGLFDSKITTYSDCLGLTPQVKAAVVKRDCHSELSLMPDLF